MKKLYFALYLCLLLAFLSACGCNHEWIEANCETPKHCSICEETEGSPLDHVWENATCTTPKTCSLCGLTDGEPLAHNWDVATCTSPKTCSTCKSTEGDPIDHSWVDATCTAPKTCSVCNQTEGEALGHTWVDATCTAPMTCSVCSVTDGEPISHNVENWEVTKKATCTEIGEEAGNCTACGEQLSRQIPKARHTPSDWQITQEATDTTKGTRSKICKVCSAELATEEFELSAAEKESYYKKSCKKYTYNEVARNPDAYLFERVTFKGKVIQVMEDDNEYTLRVRVASNQILYVWYTRTSGQSRILEDDQITLYGVFTGTVTYKTVLGASVTIPSMIATYADY